MTKTFEGRLQDWGRDRSPPLWRSGPFAAVDLTLSGRGRGVEPLLSTGAPGHDDLLEVEWLSGDQARLSYAHARKTWVHSPVFSWPGEGMHHLRLVTPALGVLDTTGELANGRLQIRLDGNDIWTTEVSYFPAPSDSVALAGFGGVSSSTQNTYLSSTILDVRQEPANP